MAGDVGGVDCGEPVFSIGLMKRLRAAHLGPWEVGYC